MQVFMKVEFREPLKIEKRSILIFSSKSLQIFTYFNRKSEFSHQSQYHGKPLKEFAQKLSECNKVKTSIMRFAQYPSHMHAYLRACTYRLK